MEDATKTARDTASGNSEESEREINNENMAKNESAENAEAASDVVERDSGHGTDASSSFGPEHSEHVNVESDCAKDLFIVTDDNPNIDEELIENLSHSEEGEFDKWVHKTIKIKSTPNSNNGRTAIVQDESPNALISSGSPDSSGKPNAVVDNGIETAEKSRLILSEVHLSPEKNGTSESVLNSNNRNEKEPPVVISSPITAANTNKSSEIIEATKEGEGSVSVKQSSIAASVVACRALQGKVADMPTPMRRFLIKPKIKSDKTLRMNSLSPDASASDPRGSSTPNERPLVKTPAEAPSCVNLPNDAVESASSQSCAKLATTPDAIRLNNTSTGRWNPVSIVLFTIIILF